MRKTLEFYGGMPFDEAIAFLRNKISMPTAHWEALWKQMHTKGFTVAGAMAEELLDDLRAAVDHAIADGTTLAQFRKEFDAVVEKFGWVYKGDRNWRSRVIYETNVRTAYQAGRYRQMTDPDVTEQRPFWQYIHSNSLNPRPHHLAWDGLVLRYDDPFWDTHYPPNGWGCKCRAVALSRRDLDGMGKAGPDPSPEIRYREWADRDGKVHQVPEGIDPGWDYNVGQGNNILRDE